MGKQCDSVVIIGKGDNQEFGSFTLGWRYVALRAFKLSSLSIESGLLERSDYAEGHVGDALAGRSEVSICIRLWEGTTAKVQCAVTDGSLPPSDNGGFGQHAENAGFVAVNLFLECESISFGSSADCLHGLGDNEIIRQLWVVSGGFIVDHFILDEGWLAYRVRRLR